ncbi:3-carboxyethylcatechol 2,3-dioxygenase [Phytohabitans suffuscus]|uniref:2,3-dihydroxyphenylpropionate/2,3-dihydroxicinnamic acid 1,2-dioxygenase n=1 Tax=Phytohabitans suffuscus TaxID=624315 RepID=A0A6F8YCI9_9ACTN|nr:3-carboxyethylcatechol 2,3-dioxygenase [Phytohabitans suffuscus]BCB83739.1 2,3-dihydroxyphenylpropionate/2,3-dihydroxicinnamic acid 1,2-dioxygenase [Phytohabitans suffuscus]
MSVALCATSHSPLIGLHDPEPSVRAEVDGVLSAARAFVADFDPELVVVFAPDHYNGFLYELMPSFCVGAAATSVGDYGLPTGPLDVDRDAAQTIAETVLAAGVDVALSLDMQVDHGFVQPLTFLFDSLTQVPIVPIFINCVAEPLGPATRARHLGAAVGTASAALGRRVLFVGSGGLSHDPPVPRLAEATPEVALRLTHGRNPTREQRAVRESGTVTAAGEFVRGSAAYRPLNPAWDDLVLRSLASADFAALDEQSNTWFVEEGGHSAHEVRTWIAAYAALAAQGPYEVVSSYYRAIPEWFAGFATTCAVPR